jgi:hypothetical protein
VATLVQNPMSSGFAEKSVYISGIWPAGSTLQIVFKLALMATVQETTDNRNYSRIDKSN